MKICPNCANEIATKENNCPECNFKFRNNNKLKYFIIILVTLILLASIFSLFFSYKNSNSKEQVLLDFENSLNNDNWLNIKKLVVHSDSTAITTVEAKALIVLNKDIGNDEVNKLFLPIQKNKFFKTYKMKASAVSLNQNDPNFKYAIEEINNNKLIPGVYNIKVTVLPDIHPVTEELTTAIMQPNTSLASKLQIKYFDFTAIGLGYAPNLTVEIDNKNYSLATLINRSPLPILTNEDFDYQYIINTPWGEIKNELLNTSNFKDFYTNNKYVTDEQYKALEQNTQKFYENLRSNQIPTTGISKNVAQLLRATAKVKTLNAKLENFQINTFSVDDNNKIDGLVSSFRVKTTNSEGIVTLFSIYDAEKNIFIIDDFLSDDFLKNHLEFSTYWLNRVSINIANLSPEQLTAHFYSIYKNSIENYKSDSDSPKYNIEELNTLKINKVQVITQNKVILDTSYQKQSKLVHERVTLIRSPSGSWHIKSST